MPAQITSFLSRHEPRGSRYSEQMSRATVAANQLVRVRLEDDWWTHECQKA